MKFCEMQSQFVTSGEWLRLCTMRARKSSILYQAQSMIPPEQKFHSVTSRQGISWDRPNFSHLPLNLPAMLLKGSTMRMFLIAHTAIPLFMTSQMWLKMMMLIESAENKKFIRFNVVRLGASHEYNPAPNWPAITFRKPELTEPNNFSPLLF